MIELNPVFSPLLTTPRRYILITGGRGSSKSFTVNTMLCDLMRISNHRILFTRYTMTAAQISIIPEFNEKITLLGREGEFEIRRRSIANINSGSDILFRGIKTSSGNQTAALKSIKGVSTWVLEEGEELKDQEIFDTIDLSVRTKAAQNRVIVVMNPTTKDHWVWQNWFEGHLTYTEIEGHKIPISNHPDVCHIHTTYLDNINNLSESYVKKILQLKETNPKKYRHKILGGWLEKAEGVIFENWEEGKFDESLPHCYGLDLGYFPDPLALIRVAVDKKRKRIYWKEELYDLKLSSGAVVGRIGSKVKNKRSLIVSDTNEPRLTSEIKSAGYNIQKARKGKDSVVTDIREIQDYTIIVDPDSQNLKRELNNYAWNDRKASIPIDDYNHLIDAGRYGFRRLLGKKKRGPRRMN